MKLPDCATLKKKYDDEDMSQIEIAELYGATRAGVSAKMRRCGIDTRDLSAARLLGIKQGRVVYDKHEES